MAGSLSTAAVLAAGAASRMGHPKQLVPFRGRPLVRHVAQVALDAGCDSVVVVLGAHETDVRAALEGLPVTIVVNDEWANGIGTSIRRAVEAVGAESDSLTLLLADQAFITPDDVRMLHARQRESGAPVVASRYAGTVGVPATFHRRVFADLRALGDGSGCKQVIQGHAGDSVLLDMPHAAIDIDTPADLPHLDAAG